MNRYDIVIIGSGAGLMVLEAAMNRGLKCAIIENGKFGGTCLTKGCIPSKMLVYPADLIREIQSSERVGVSAGETQIDWDAVSRRMWEQIDFHSEIETSLENISGLEVYKGTGFFAESELPMNSGTFAGAFCIAVQYADGKPNDIIYGDKIIIAAGARSAIPPIAGLEKAGYLTSETFFGEKYPAKPWKSLAIIGGGAVGAEFAHIFSAFGTKVTLIERAERILSAEEPEISQFVERQFTQHGINVLTNSAAVSASAGYGLKLITVENSLTGEKTTLECEEIFIASGLRSNADRLSLEKAGVATDKNGWIITNSYLETSRENIWALGDINGKFQFRHKANHEAQILIENLFGTEKKKEVSYAAVPWTIFTYPQVAHLGMTEQELAQMDIKYHAAKNYYSDVVGGRAMGYGRGDDDNGFVKMIVGENKEILGVHIVGPQASVLLQPFVYLMNQGYRCGRKIFEQENTRGIDGLRILCPHIGTYIPINDSMVVHPSLSELTAWVFENFETV